MNTNVPLYPRDISFDYQGISYTLPNFALKDAKETENLIKLFERKKGTIFRVNKQGELVEVKGRKDWIAYKWKVNHEKVKIRGVINSALEQFNAFLSQLEDQKVAEAAVKYFFDKKGKFGIGRLSQALYNQKEFLKTDTVFAKYLLAPNTIRIKLSEHKFVDLTNEKFAGKQIPFPLQMNLGNERLNHNFWMLLNRKKGQIYQVNAQGRLEQAKRPWFCCSGKSTRNKKVQRAVTEVIKGLNAYLTKTTLTDIHQIVLDQIFSPNSSLCRMNQRVFNRGAIAEGSFLELQLSQGIVEKRAELINALRALGTIPKEEEKKRIEKALMNIVFEEFSFAQRLGIDLEKSWDGGTGGARYARDRYGHRILVIKPGDEGPSGVNNPRWYKRLLRLLISPKACLEGNSEPRAEEDSWLWDRTFGIWSVPPTEIRYVSSRDFVGRTCKECSVQMFVEGCSTLGKYINLSSKIYWMPRRFLRWYCGSRFDTGCFYAFGQREEKKKELLEKLPIRSLERLGMHNKGIEDLDCHPDNILVFIRNLDASQSKSVFNHIFEKEQPLNKDEIDSCVGHFFRDKKHQSLLAELLFSEEIEVNGVRKKISLIKHDGGASNPRYHPSWWDFLSLRNMHLFEILPHFENMFSNESKELINGKDKEDLFARFLLEKGTGNVRNILTHEVFEDFWSIAKNRSLLKRWIFATRAENESTLRDKLILRLCAATQKKPDRKPSSALLYYFNHHLKRIRDGLQTRVDSFRVLRYYVNSTNTNMRALFKDVKTAGEFKAALGKIDDGFDHVMERWQGRKVKQGTTPKKLFPSTSTERVSLFEGYGESSV